MSHHAFRLAAAAAFAASAMAAIAPAASAQPTGFPCKLVKFVVPYPPGGSSDLLARMLVPGVAQSLGTTIVVENRAGAVGNIGTAQVAGAEPDGCTWLMGNSTNVVISRNLYKLARDPVEYLAPVAEVAAVPMVLYVNASVPANTFQEFVELLRRNPGKYSYATPGSGSTHQLLSELMRNEFALSFTHVPYKGSGPAIQDVIAGHVHFAFEGTSAIAPHIASGKVRALATTGALRSTSIPNIPTFKEMGHGKFVVTNWYGVFVPAKTPEALVHRMNAALRQSMKAPDMAASLAKLDSQAGDHGAAQFATAVRGEIPYWRNLVTTTGVTVD